MTFITDRGWHSDGQAPAVDDRYRVTDWGGKCPPRLTLADVLQRTGGVYETTLPLSPSFRDRLDPQTRITPGCRLGPTPEESARLPCDEHPPDPKNTLFSDDYTMPEGDEYILPEA